MKHLKGRSFKKLKLNNFSFKLFNNIFMYLIIHNSFQIDQALKYIIKLSCPV